MIKDLKWEKGATLATFHAITPTEYSPFQYIVFKEGRTWMLEVYCELQSVPIGEPYVTTLPFKRMLDAMNRADEHFKNFIKGCLKEENV